MWIVELSRSKRCDTQLRAWLITTQPPLKCPDWSFDGGYTYDSKISEERVTNPDTVMWKTAVRRDSTSAQSLF